MDVVFAARCRSGQETVFADDLSVFNEFNRDEDDSRITTVMQATRNHVHAWGARNRVAFDPSKEQIAIIHPI